MNNDRTLPSMRVVEQRPRDLTPIELANEQLADLMRQRLAGEVDEPTWRRRRRDILNYFDPLLITAQEPTVLAPLPVAPPPDRPVVPERRWWQLRR